MPHHTLAIVAIYRILSWGLQIFNIFAFHFGISMLSGIGLTKICRVTKR